MADGHARAEFVDAPETPYVSPAGDAARRADSATQATPASTSKSSADELPKSPLALVVDSARKAVSAGVARVLSLGRTVSGAERVADALAGVAEDGQLDFAERGRAKSLRYRLHATPQHVKAAVEAARTAHFALRRRVINLRRNVRDVISKEVEGALFDVQDLLLPHAETAALSAVGAETDPSAILPSLTAPLHRSMLESFQLVSAHGLGFPAVTTGPFWEDPAGVHGVGALGALAGTASFGPVRIYDFTETGSATWPDP